MPDQPSALGARRGGTAELLEDRLLQHYRERRHRRRRDCSWWSTRRLATELHAHRGSILRARDRLVRRGCVRVLTAEEKQEMGFQSHWAVVQWVGERPPLPRKARRDEGIARSAVEEPPLVKSEQQSGPSASPPTTPTPSPSQSDAALLLLAQTEMVSAGVSPFDAMCILHDRDILLPTVQILLLVRGLAYRCRQDRPLNPGGWFRKALKGWKKTAKEVAEARRKRAEEQEKQRTAAEAERLKRRQEEAVWAAQAMPSHVRIRPAYFVLGYEFPIVEIERRKTKEDWLASLTKGPPISR